MSIAVMTEVWKDAPVSGTELLMLLALADSCNDDRECWPSLRHLQHKVRVSRPQAQRLLKNLEQQSLIESVKKGGRGAKGRETNLYRLLSMTGITGDTSALGGTGITGDTTTGIVGDTLNRNSEPLSDPLAPSGAGGRKTPKKKTEPKPRPRNLIFDAVALGSFDLTDVSADKTVGARVGKLVAWLKQNRPDVTAERIAEFYAWYESKNESASAPRDAGKFGSWWLKFEAAGDDDPFAEMFAHMEIIGDAPEAVRQVARKVTPIGGSS